MIDHTQAQEAKATPWDVKIDPTARSVTISHRRLLDIAPQVTVIPWATIKEIAATILQLEVGIEAAAQEVRAQKGRARA